jgi:MoaA/NifB/PqqE/SkfB family radical SAM enzyme
MNSVAGIVNEARRVFNQTDLDSLILFVTNACNLSCGFCCYADNLNQTKDISFENMLRISQTMPKFRALLISGGEPFIRPKLDKIMLAFCRNNAIRNIYIPTNGWYLDRTQEMCRGFLEKERNVMLTLSFSVDGLQQTHDRIRAEGKRPVFETLCKTVETLRPWQEKYPNIRLRLNSVVTPDNIDEMQATVDYFFERYHLDEHGLEIVRDLSWLGAHHDSPRRQHIARRYVDLVEYAYNLYYRHHATDRRQQLGYLPEKLSNLATYAYSQAMAEVKLRRIMGQLWTFPCTAGRKILVINGSGSLRACELRGEVADLRQYDFDVAKALASGAMDREQQRIACDRCDCIHGCFVGNSIQHSPRAVARLIAPNVIKGLMPWRRTGHQPPLN